MSLAAKLPWNHRFAGGFPGLSSQPLPTDADAIDYLTRMATADGAGVEVGVATAVDAFFRDAKDSGVFSALKACCILAGARTLAGAFVPVVGDAPTPNGFVSGDYSRTAGLGDPNATSYLNSERANDADPQDDQHMGVYITSPNMQNVGIYIGSDPSSTVGANQISVVGTLAPGALFSYSRIVSGPEYDATAGEADQIGLSAISRSESGKYYLRTTGETLEKTRTSSSPSSSNIFVFDRGPSGGAAPTDATIAFYSIGTSLSLEDLDTAVTNLIAAIGEAL